MIVKRGYRIPDHSVLVWDILVDGVVPKALFVATEDGKAQPRKSLLSQKTTCVVWRNLLGLS